MRGARVEVLEDAAGEWRWRRQSGNGEIVAVSGEGYSRRSDAYEAAVRENPGVRVTYAESDEDPEC